MARIPKAKTAYELLGRVCQAIQAHPLNYYQEKWIVQGDTLPLALKVPENTCGTAFCRAGWMVALHDGHEGLDSSSISKRAGALLGMDMDQTWSLFSGYACGEFTPGTRAYVRAGVRGIRAFMKQHKARLQARTLRGV